MRVALWTGRVVLAMCLCCLATNAARADHIRDLQTAAIEANRADFGHWGHDPANYKQWGSHTNRLIPVYTFGTLTPGGSTDKLSRVDLRNFNGANSAYRSEIGRAHV